MYGHRVHQHRLGRDQRFRRSAQQPVRGRRPAPAADARAASSRPGGFREHPRPSTPPARAGPDETHQRLRRATPVAARSAGPHDPLGGVRRTDTRDIRTCRPRDGGSAFIALPRTVPEPVGSPSSPVVRRCSRTWPLGLELGEAGKSGERSQPCLGAATGPPGTAEARDVPACSSGDDGARTPAGSLLMG